MIIIRFLVCIVAVLLAAPSAFAETPLRVRGHVAAINDSSITIRSNVGATFRIPTDLSTVYANVLPSSLNAIKRGTYIGTAVKGSLKHLVAVEIVLIPESMRAGRVGYYPWDPLPDTSGVGASGASASGFGTGLVLESSLRSGTLVETNMTNGVVAATCRNPVGRRLLVNLVGRMPVYITVSPHAPVVQFAISGRSAVALGSAVVIWTTPGNGARLVAVGKGVVPPM